MKIAIPREIHGDETRVAASPDTVKRFAGFGLDVVVEQGAGQTASFSDDDFSAAGAKIASSAADCLGGADIVLKVTRPEEAELAHMQKGAMLVATMAPFQDKELIGKCAAAGVNAFAMELMPRISRAQSMDILSSQSNLAGYKAVIDGAAAYGRAMPMMMTAAGTVAPARVLVMGAGVAGLQAIATAKRLGAIVSATDVRPVAKEQVESLGGRFLMVETEETKDAETAGGYAKEMSDDYKRQQAELIAEEIKKQDIVICTALIPGRAAPVLVSAEMVDTMKHGAVIVDLAVEQGGNCPLSVPGEVVDHQGVKILGYKNVPGRLASDASSLYSRNLFNFVSPYLDAETGVLTIDWEDELVLGTALTRDGAIIHPDFK